MVGVLLTKGTLLFRPEVGLVLGTVCEFCGNEAFYPHSFASSR